MTGHMLNWIKCLFLVSQCFNLAQTQADNFLLLLGDESEEFSCENEASYKQTPYVVVAKPTVETKPCECYFQISDTLNRTVNIYKGHKVAWALKNHKWGTLEWNKKAGYLYLNLTDTTKVEIKPNSTSPPFESIELSVISLTVSIEDLKGEAAAGDLFCTSEGDLDQAMKEEQARADANLAQAKMASLMFPVIVVGVILLLILLLIIIVLCCRCRNQSDRKEASDPGGESIYQPFGTLYPPPDPNSKYQHQSDDDPSRHYATVEKATAPPLPETQSLLRGTNPADHATENEKTESEVDCHDIEQMSRIQP